MSVVYPVSASNWTPISAYYPYDDNIKIPSQFVQWSDGYTGFIHNAFKSNIDCAINKNSMLYLPGSMSLFDFLTDTQISRAQQGAYISLSITTTGNYFDPPVQYVVVKDGSLYLNQYKADSGLFRFILNDNGSFSLMQGNGEFVTVQSTTPFNLDMNVPLPQNEIHRQQFYWHEYNNMIYLTTKTLDPMNPGSWEERFWSFSKVGPEKGRMRASGFWHFGDFITSDFVYLNDYLFDVEGFRIYYDPDGLVTDHNWVRYYNELIQKENNLNVEIYKDRSASGVYISHLFDVPYDTEISIENRSMAVNLANLKNVMTGEYKYRVRNEPLVVIEPTTTTTTTTVPPFKVWELEYTIPSEELPPDEMTIKIRATGVVYNMFIDWDDGDGWEVLESSLDSQSHTYTTTGVKNVKIGGPEDATIEALRLAYSDEPFVEFSYLTNVLNPIPNFGMKSCNHMFSNCWFLSTIPENVFTNNPNITGCRDAFGNSGLINIPDGLFTGLDITLFIDTFRGCSNLSGSAPALWDIYPAADGTGCFKDCTGLDNYADIPDHWK